MKAKLIFLLQLFIMNTSSDKYPYANFYDIAKLNNFGLNPYNPVDSLRILTRNQNYVDKVNIFGALYGILQIMKNYQLSVEDLLTLEKPQQSNLNLSLTAQELKSLEKVQNLSDVTVDSNCQTIQEYAETSDLTLKCQIKVENLSCYKVENLYKSKPLIVLVHDYDSSIERSNWINKINILESFHMRSLYDIPLAGSVEEHFEMLQSFKREGKIGFIPTDMETMKAEDKLRHLLQSLNIPQKRKKFDSYQFGTYGIGGFIDDHLDTYGSPGEPMEDILDFNSDSDSMNWQGDRYITALSYLNGHWSQGGATVFSKLNISVPLNEGNILIWENLNVDTMAPLETATHRSCPIIYGPKLVLNKWLRAL